jgi:DNA topoisomerase-1
MARSSKSSSSSSSPQKKPKKRKKESSDEDDYSDYDKKPKKKPNRSSSASSASPTKKGKGGKKEEEEVWKWWEEAPRDDGVKWNYLEHKGPVFAPDYEPLPKDVQFRYDGKVLKLSRDAEEIAGFYSRFIEHDYTTKDKFNDNFFKVRNLNNIN